MDYAGPRCATCLWWTPETRSGNRWAGHCRRYPPVPRVGQPITTAHHGCGEHAEADDEALAARHKLGVRL